jgi:hypothetical protein
MTITSAISPSNSLDPVPVSPIIIFTVEDKGVPALPLLVSSLPFAYINVIPFDFDTIQQ